MSREILRIFALALIAVAALLAQTTFGIVRGRVVDASGAAVPNVTVVVRNTATNIAKPVTSNEADIYEAGYLQPGTYTVEAEQPGFRKFVVQDILLNANAIVPIDVRLEVGEITSSVTIGSAAPLITTESATIADIKTVVRRNSVPNRISELALAVVIRYETLRGRF